MKNLKKFNELLSFEDVYVIIHKRLQGELSICYIYDSFEMAMNSKIWKEYDDKPNDKGEGEFFKICNFELNNDFN
jgi:hypothetical protein